MEPVLISTLRQQLKGVLPGMEAQFEMAHLKREKIHSEDLNSDNHNKSAVLLLLCKNKNGWFIPLTERHVYNGAHSGQISLPGGKYEEADGNLEKTALRECYEEIGIKSDIELLGALTPIYIPVSKFLVHTFIGFLNTEKINYVLNPKEVKQLIELPIKELINPGLVKQTTVEPVKGLKFKTPYFDVQGKVVWGATAMILNELKHLLMQNAIYFY